MRRLEIGKDGSRFQESDQLNVIDDVAVQKRACKVWKLQDPCLCLGRYDTEIGSGQLFVRIFCTQGSILFVRIGIRHTKNHNFLSGFRFDLKNPEKWRKKIGKLLQNTLVVYPVIILQLQI